MVFPHLASFYWPTYTVCPLDCLAQCYFAAGIVRGNIIAYRENAIDFILKREIFCRTVALHDKNLIALGWTNAAVV
jgi:hypothetical protein